jgi:hypothetical protein
MRNEETSWAVDGSNESWTKPVGESDGGGDADLRPVRESHLWRVSLYCSKLRDEDAYIVILDIFYEPLEMEKGYGDDDFVEKSCWQRDKTEQ